VLHHQKKGPHLNTTERFYIHVEHAASNHLNDDRTIFPNKIFDTLIKLNASLTPWKLPRPKHFTHSHTFHMN
jgi:hypothetical protein